MLLNTIIAHRGIHYKYLENTIPAFIEAINKKCIIELDVRLTKDNQVIVFHDHNLKRIFGINRDIKDLTIKEIKKYNYIPTLEDVLKLVNNRVPIIIEVKHSKGIEKRLTNILDKYNGIFFIQSFNPYTILWFKNKKKYLIGLLTYNFFHLKSILFILRPNYIATNLNNLINIQKYRKKYIVLGYTLKTKKEYQKYKDYADNFICDIQGKIKNKETVPLRTASQKE